MEARLIHDSTKSWLDFRSYSGGITTSTSYANNYDSSPCNDANVLGTNFEAGFDQLITNANNIKQILGDSDAGGFSFGWNKGFDAELSIMQQDGKNLILPNGNPIFEISAGIPYLGINYGIEGHSGVKGHTTGWLGFDFSRWYGIIRYLINLFELFSLFLLRWGEPTMTSTLTNRQTTVSAA